MDALYFYCLNAILVFALQGHARDFKGSNQKILSAMNLMVVVGTLSCTVFFFMHGFKVSWLEAVGGFVGSMIVGALVPPNLIVSMIAIVAIPVLSVAIFLL